MNKKLENNMIILCGGIENLIVFILIKKESLKNYNRRDGRVV